MSAHMHIREDNVTLPVDCLFTASVRRLWVQELAAGAPVSLQAELSLPADHGL